MKYTVEQKASIKGMESFKAFKLMISKQYNLGYKSFKIEGDFLVIGSKINNL